MGTAQLRDTPYPGRIQFGKVAPKAELPTLQSEAEDSVLLGRVAIQLYPVVPLRNHSDKRQRPREYLSSGRSTHCSRH